MITEWESGLAEMTAEAEALPDAPPESVVPEAPAEAEMPPAA
jgi:hypothetical protein